jgi:hypothetical protein
VMVTLVGLFVRTCKASEDDEDPLLFNMLNAFATDTPRSVPLIHTATWIANFVCMFLILAAHERKRWEYDACL